ncbi:transposable element Tcb1 transposase [Trichonephila clavipes]|nr:transposable element Tcb1 transposase [Trichonephila clavipes]
MVHASIRPAITTRDCPQRQRRGYAATTSSRRKEHEKYLLTTAPNRHFSSQASKAVVGKRLKKEEKLEIGSLVERNQTTVMRICDRWMQEGTTDRRGRSHPPQCTTSREDRQIGHMAVSDC